MRSNDGRVTWRLGQSYHSVGDQLGVAGRAAHGNESTKGNAGLGHDDLFALANLGKGGRWRPSEFRQ